MEKKTFILNFGHKLTRQVLDELEPCEEVFCPLDLDLDRETMGQVVRQVQRISKEVGKKGGALDGTSPLIVALPGLTEGAVLLLAELHGRLGVFPRILRLRRQEDGTYGLFVRSDEVRGGVFDLERFRRSARGRR